MCVKLLLSWRASFCVTWQDEKRLAQKAEEEDRQINGDKAKIAAKLAQPKVRKLVNPASATELPPALVPLSNDSVVSSLAPLQGIFDPTHKTWSLEEILS